MLHLGFTGTRHPLPPLQQAALWKALKDLRPDFAHHGDCVGADAIFDEMCRELGVSIFLHPPTNDKYRAFCEERHGSTIKREPKPYLDRNNDIVRESSQLFACPRGPEIIRSGTWATIRKARTFGLTITIIWPNGSVERSAI